MTAKWQLVATAGAAWEELTSNNPLASSEAAATPCMQHMHAAYTAMDMQKQLNITPI